MDDHTKADPREQNRLAALGWNEAFATSFAEVTAASPGALPARVIARHRGLWRVATAAGDANAVLAGRFRTLETSHGRGSVSLATDPLPAVGDWVSCEGAGGTAAITVVLPRRSAVVRRRPGTQHGAQVIAANVDVVLIAASLALPLNMRRLERLVALGWESGAVPVIVLTKLDVALDAEATRDAAVAACPGTDVVAVSALTAADLDELRPHLRPGSTAVILGESGAGKSTLTNALLGDERGRTSGLLSDGRGRHTTTHRELFRLAEGGLLIDTPGLREVGLWDAEAGVEAVFDEIGILSEHCRFRDCAHDTEPGCAVRAAVADGSLEPARLEAWHKLQLELAHLRRRGDPAASALEKARVKSAQRVYRQHLRKNPGDAG